MVWDKTKVLKYKSIYLTSKTWVLLKLQHFHPSQQISPSVEENFNPINDKKQRQLFTPTPIPINVTLDPANALGSTLPAKVLLVQIYLVRVPPTSAYPIQIPTAQVLPIQISLTQTLLILTAILQTPLLVLLAPSPLAKHSHRQSEMHLKQVKIMSDKVNTFTNKHVDAQLTASEQKEI